MAIDRAHQPTRSNERSLSGKGMATATCRRRDDRPGHRIARRRSAQSDSAGSCVGHLLPAKLPRPCTCAARAEEEAMHGSASERGPPELLDSVFGASWGSWSPDRSTDRVEGPRRACVHGGGYGRSVDRSDALCRSDQYTPCLPCPCMQLGHAMPSGYPAPSSHHTHV